MKIRFTKQLSEQHPNVREAVVIISGIDNTTHPDHSFQFLCDRMDRERKLFTKYQQKEHELSSDSWQQLFTTLGFNEKKIKPSHVALQSRVILDRTDLPNINPVVNITNALQLEHKLPIGAHNLENIEGDITVGENSRELKFNPRGEKSKLENVEATEIVHADTVNVLTRRWCWRQGDKDLCDEKSMNIIFFINSLAPNQDLKKIATELVHALQKFSGNKDLEVKFGVLSNKTLELDSDAMKSLIVDPKNPISLETREISRDKDLIEKILYKAIEEILPSNDTLEKLLNSGRRLRVYQGFDPSADTLHIGHTVSMRRLEWFRQLGHEVIFLIGDFTAQIGDPDKSSARNQLTFEEVRENLKLYKSQAKKIIDVDSKDNPVKVLFNNDWLGKMSFSDVIELTSQFTVQQMLKRDMFVKRIESGTPLYIHEFMYPMMQGWDAVHMEVDIEVGGNDQLFNMMAGRHLVENILGKDKVVIAGKLLATADGSKMGKTTNNMIKLNDTPNDIYGKVMAMTDMQIVNGFELLTDLPMRAVESIEKELEEGGNPMELKKRLALELTTELKGEDEANKAREYFEEVFQSKSFETDIAEVSIPETPIKLVDLLSTYVDKDQSKSQLRRMVEQGAVKINNDKSEVWDKEIVVAKGDIIKLGKNVVRVG